MAIEAAVWGQCRQALENLLKYADRERFAEARDVIGAAHFASAYAALGEDGDVDSLMELMDEDLVAGIADDAGIDFAVRIDTGGKTLVDRYLDERGARETPAGRDYLRGLKASRVGVFEVLSGERDGALELEDQLERGPTLRVADDPDLDPLERGELIAARVIPFRDRLCFVGGVWTLDPESVDALRAAWAGEGVEEFAAGEEEVPAEELQASLRDNLAAMISNIVLQQELAWDEDDDQLTS